MKVALLFAMESEARGLIERLGLTPEAAVSPLPHRVFSGRDLSLTWTGRDERFGCDRIGTEAAAMATFSTIERFRPDVVISAGTCGSFASKGAAIGKVYLSRDRFFFHDRQVSIDGWDRYVLGGFPSKDVRSLAERLGFETANVTSGNSLDFTDEELARIHASGAILKEMEGAAVAWAAEMLKTPMFAIKSVTNLIDANPDSAGEFQKNFSVAVDALTEATLKVLAAL